MRTKNSLPLTPQEAAHLAAVKALPCSFCDAPAPSHAHHIKQGDHFTTVACCDRDHVGPGGIHGGEYALPFSIERALNITLARLAGSRIRPERERARASTRTPSKIVPRAAA